MFYKYINKTNDTNPIIKTIFIIFGLIFKIKK